MRVPALGGNGGCAGRLLVPHFSLEMGGGRRFQFPIPKARVQNGRLPVSERTWMCRLCLCMVHGAFPMDISSINTYTSHNPQIIVNERPSFFQFLQKRNLLFQGSYFLLQAAVATASQQLETANLENRKLRESNEALDSLRRMAARAAQRLKLLVHRLKLFSELTIRHFEIKALLFAFHHVLLDKKMSTFQMCDLP
jgi:hypothetical protein